MLKLKERIRSIDLFDYWFPYWEWECYQSGMWENRKNDMSKVQACAKLLSDEKRCEEAMIRAIHDYPISAKQHLTKPNGKRPWLGQAACCVDFGATEEETRHAWNFYMTEQEQTQANNIADKVIQHWEACNA